MPSTAPEASRLDVVAAVIRDAGGRVLLARRPDHKHQGGRWEFPGGKVEAGESLDAALARELEEELGLIVDRLPPLHDRGSSLS
jgi:8-oxo-dGTP diphosphatase